MSKLKGTCFYFIGLSASGKTTLALALKSKLENILPNKQISFLDGDIIRTHLSKGLGFSKEDRSINVRRIGYVASEIVKHNGIVIVANIAPYEEDRLYNKNIISEYGNYIEFFVDTPIEECERRDFKGNYKLAKEGKITKFTGISDPFEKPTSSIIIKNDNLEETNNYIFSYIKNLNLI